MSEYPLPFGWSINKWLLVLLNMFAGIAIIILSHMSVLPLDDVNFLFFSFVGLLFALYRPGWAFLLLVGMVPYEIINIAPENYLISLRPYQWLLVLVILSLLTRLALKRFPLEKFVPNMWDIAVVGFSLSAFLSALMSDDKSLALKLSIILLTFVLLYFVTRIFVRSVDDARMLLPFIFSSFLIIACYALLQNIFFLNGKESFEVMAGRPNATFSEADWFGGYLTLVLVTLSALIAVPVLISKNGTVRPLRFIFSGLLFFGFVALLITVSRSAWLATFFGIISVLCIYAWQNDVWRALIERNRVILMDVFHIKLHIIAPFLLAFFVVYISGLSPFDLADRSRSATTGEQKITVACTKKITLPEKITQVEELALYGCEHIRLEEIGTRQTAGEYVTEVFRNDPNVSTRRDIYVKVASILKDHLLFGIGFGNISLLLGTDDRGAGLNASNIFLEVWLGAGAIGFFAFIFFWFGLGAQWFYRGVKVLTPLAVVMVPLWISLTLFNLFNSGLFLGSLFIFMAFLLISLPHEYT